jgi:fibronectin type 3 domain-containing protein
MGKYLFSGLPSGAYVIAASQAGYAFTPPAASVSINGASVSGVSFTATAVPAPMPHTVSLSWTGSTSSNVQGYNVYRAAVAGGAYTKVNASPVATTVYVDGSVASGHTYYYVATTVDSNNVESSYSNLATAVVPAP